MAQTGDDTPIDWLPRDRRYAEKLATPDITIADLIGEVDPIRVAEGRYLSDELTLHYGLIPRATDDIDEIEDYLPLGQIMEGTLDEIEARRAAAAAAWSACPPASPTSTSSPTACTPAR